VRPVQRISEAALESFSITKNPPGITGPDVPGAWNSRGHPREKIHARATSGDTREYLKRQTFERASESKRRAEAESARDLLDLLDNGKFSPPNSSPPFSPVAISRITTALAALCFMPR
jgi:hypothetical protein